LKITNIEKRYKIFCGIVSIEKLKKKLAKTRENNDAESLDIFSIIRIEMISGFYMNCETTKDTIERNCEDKSLYQTK